MSFREHLSGLLARSGALRAALALRAHIPVPWLSVLTYHRIQNPDCDEPFDDGVVDVTARDFDRQLACLKEHFNLVGIDELCAFAAGKDLPPNSVAITFDDGYLDCYERALPILKRHGASAIFFVSTSAITERRVYWWDRVAYLIKRSGRDRLRLRYPKQFDLELPRDRAPAIQSVLRLIKAHQPLELERFLGELGEAVSVSWTREMERAFADRLLMTWDHVRALRDAGMDVESHTRTHRVLHTLSPEELLDELEGSRADLARELGRPARALAYPVGNPLRKSSPIRLALDKAGYELGFSNGTGPTRLGAGVDRFNICRQTVDLNLSQPYLLSILTMPALAPKHPWHLTAR